MPPNDSVKGSRHWEGFQPDHLECGALSAAFVFRAPPRQRPSRLALGAAAAPNTAFPPSA